MQEPLNILFIMADQFRRDALGITGGYARTPALDSLAREGVLFRRATTNSPHCIPARLALATGLYPHQTGVWSNGPVTLSPGAWTWMKALAEAGYRTSLFGKAHFHTNGDLRQGLELMHGYGLQDVDEIAGPRGSMYVLSNMTEHWQDAGIWELYRRDFQDRFDTKPYVARPSPLGVEHYYDTYVGSRAREYLSNYDRPQPWFCWVSFGGPHEPWDAPQPYDTMYDPAGMPAAIPRMADHEQVDGLLHHSFRSTESPALTPQDVAAMRANYAGNVTLIDDQIAGLVKTIKARGDYDNTLVIFTSDHGEMNGDHGLIYKGHFLAPAVEIPLVVRPPRRDGTTPSFVSGALVELMDVGATILDYAGLPVPAWSNARSLRLVLERRTEVHRDFVLSEFIHHTMIANQRWKAEFAPNGAAVLLFDAAESDEHTNLVHRMNAESATDAVRQSWRAALAQASASVQIA